MGYKTEHKFEKETDLCAEFLKHIPEEWTAYCETAGFDILLVRKADGFQIGIEAKLKLNAKVIMQVAEPVRECHVTSTGPDCRAVLIPEYAETELSGLCEYLGITVMTQRHPQDRIGYSHRFWPDLPILREELEWWQRDDNWHEFWPFKRCKVPDYVPDVIAGDKAPVTLTHWKIGAIKIAITLEKNGQITRQDFEHFRISMSRWTQGGWLEKGKYKGNWVKGRNFPDFRSQHPVNYQQIEDDYDTWKKPDVPVDAMI